MKVTPRAGAINNLSGPLQKEEAGTGKIGANSLTLYNNKRASPVARTKRKGGCANIEFVNWHRDRSFLDLYLQTVKPFYIKEARETARYCQKVLKKPLNWYNVLLMEYSRERMSRYDLFHFYRKVHLEGNRHNTLHGHGYIYNEWVPWDPPRDVFFRYYEHDPETGHYILKPELRKPKVDEFGFPVWPYEKSFWESRAPLYIDKNQKFSEDWGGYIGVGRTQFIHIPWWYESHLYTLKKVYPVCVWHYTEECAETGVKYISNPEEYFQHHF